MFNNDKLFNHSASITHNLNNINTKNELIEENLTKTMISDTDENNGCHNKTITDTRNYSKLSDMQSPDNNSDNNNDNKLNPNSLHTSGIVDSIGMFCKLSENEKQLIIEHQKQSSCHYHHQQHGITFNDVSIGEDYQENNSVISTTITSSMISTKSLSLTMWKHDKLSTSHQQSLSYNRNAGDNPSCKDVYINRNGGGTDNFQ
ncbi:hypothetical protein EWB00_002632 [Schistosoma japonicum]|uniref:Uncharacterized protein n=1 Tax=Schistosoma japonicum TaxID=6182 RepID=A0A4Z2DC57_SCHJA|nr:hypothetical protein EWB00_002632 [Schistosoma japonicum]